MHHPGYLRITWNFWQSTWQVLPIFPFSISQICPFILSLPSLTLWGLCYQYWVIVTGSLMCSSDTFFTQMIHKEQKLDHAILLLWVSPHISPGYKLLGKAYETLCAHPFVCMAASNFTLKQEQCSLLHSQASSLYRASCHTSSFTQAYWFFCLTLPHIRIRGYYLLLKAFYNFLSHCFIFLFTVSYHLILHFTF